MANVAHRKLIQKNPQLEEHLAIFRDSLKAARKQQGYTQKELSMRLGMSTGTVGALETGILLPSLELLLLLADVLEVTPNELLGYPNWAYDNEIKRRFNENHIEDGLETDPESARLRVG